MLSCSFTGRPMHVTGFASASAVEDYLSLLAKPRQLQPQQLASQHARRLARQTSRCLAPRTFWSAPEGFRRQTLQLRLTARTSAKTGSSGGSPPASSQSSGKGPSSSKADNEAASEFSKRLFSVVKAIAVLAVTAAIRILEALLTGMGVCLSKDERVASLESQVQQLQSKLASQGANATFAPMGTAVTGGSLNEVIFFPDKAMPCRHGRNCRRGPSCQYAHGPTSLTRLLNHIASARQSLDICIFTLTCNEIAEQVATAAKRGVRVRIITDDDQMRTTGSDIMELRQSGIPVRHDANVAHMHHKFAVIDHRLLLNGSFNWTRQAVLQNQENVMVTDNPQMVQQFAERFDKLWTQYAGNAV